MLFLINADLHKLIILGHGSIVPWSETSKGRLSPPSIKRPATICYNGVRSKAFISQSISHMAEEVVGFAVGVIVGAVLITIVCASVVDKSVYEAQLRALSCMGNGMTIEQCKDVLGITRNP